MKLSYAALVLALLFLTVSSCGLKIETGQTVDEATESNQQRASRIRASWAEQLRNKPPMTMAGLVKTHIDSVSAMYLRYGYRIVEQWQQGNEGRGQPVDASEMREVVNSWVVAEKPILKAYEDNLEYGLRLVRDSRHYDQNTMDLFDQLARAYYDCHSIVFYPNNNVDTYEEELIDTERRIRQLSEELERKLRVYNN
ncbi:MAG: hypothetical protein V3T75_04995 [candidate division Zixibacteria bacterium]